MSHVFFVIYEILVVYVIGMLFLLLIRVFCIFIVDHVIRFCLELSLCLSHVSVILLFVLNAAKMLFVCSLCDCLSFILFVWLIELCGS
ncbi:hypothetical protein HanPI659440_Chr16g0654901 [Helianthus annuus]|nr:hypothetical protein HanPI659440_Chr16g0654901 [Helianthus annuus]